MFCMSVELIGWAYVTKLPVIKTTVSTMLANRSPITIRFLVMSVVESNGYQAVE